MEKQIPIPQSLKSRWTLWLVSFSIQIWRAKKNSLSYLLGIGTENRFSQPTYSCENFGYLYVGLWGIVELVFALPFKWMILFPSILFQSINYISYFTNLCVYLYIYICIQIHWSINDHVKKLPMYIFLNYYLFWRL